MNIIISGHNGNEEIVAQLIEQFLNINGLKVERDNSSSYLNLSIEQLDAQLNKLKKEKSVCNLKVVKENIPLPKGKNKSYSYDPYYDLVANPRNVVVAPPQAREPALPARAARHEDMVHAVDAAINRIERVMNEEDVQDEPF